MKSYTSYPDFSQHLQKAKNFHMPPCHANLEKTEFVPKNTHKPTAKEFHYNEKEIATISALLLS
jgi:hypothetical protein